MTRLIDADELLVDLRHRCSNETFYKQVKESLIDCAPTIDAVKIVRCINCDNYAPTESGKLGYCCVNDGIWMANDFCIHGRPREGE